jgi:hypothetical protein
MIDLSGARVFLSASFPSGERGEPFRPYDPDAIAEAVTAVAQAVLTADGRIVFGAHPTISPLILLIAVELDRHEVVEIYQSRYFEGRVPKETTDLIRRGYGVVHWTRYDPDDLHGSLRVMRQEMLSRGSFAAAVFVGGMEGILEEDELVRTLQPHVPRLPLRAPGGAARVVVPSRDRIAMRLAARLDSPRYPALAREIVAELAEARQSRRS